MTNITKFKQYLLSTVQTDIVLVMADYHWVSVGLVVLYQADWALWIQKGLQIRVRIKVCRKTVLHINDYILFGDSVEMINKIVINLYCKLRYILYG